MGIPTEGTKVTGLVVELTTPEDKDVALAARSSFGLLPEAEVGVTVLKGV